MTETASKQPIFVEPNLEQVLCTSAPERFRLWNKEDFAILKKELADNESYSLLKDDQTNRYKLWVKTKGEGSGIYNESNSAEYHDVDCAKSAFTRHKYTCEFDFSVREFYNVTRDLKRRVEWDHRTLHRQILNIFVTEDGQTTETEAETEATTITTAPPSSLKYQVLEKMIKRTGPMMADRDCITLSAEMWEGDTCYFFTKSIPMKVADDIYGKSTEYVRSNVLFLGMKLEPNGDNSMKYSCITQLDPHGWIVSGLMNWATKFIPKAFRREMIHAVEMRRTRGYSEDFVNYFQLSTSNNTTTETTTTTSNVMMDVQ